MKQARLKQARLKFALLAVLMVPMTALPALAGDLAVVVRPDTPVENLSFADLRKLLLGERQFWNSTTKVTLLIRAPQSRERDVVLKSVYKMTEAQFREYWISKVFRQEASSGPKIVYSAAMAIELVQAIPGSVAFVDAAEVPKSLKIIRVGGKMPGDADYALK